MRSSLATLLNNAGNSIENRGHQALARSLYQLAAKISPTWSVPWYNLGLQSKYQRDWAASAKYNNRAIALNPEDEGAWWNLAIAATALRDWAEARRAWRGFGIDIDDSDGEVVMPLATACVRLSSSSSNEVVWGTRIDPARIRIENIPLPESGRLYLDILLNDGAQNGTRVSNEQEYPVFDELEIWEPSKHSTYTVLIHVENAASADALVELCQSEDVAVEDWSTVRRLCVRCSEGNPGPHICDNQPVLGEAIPYGFAAADRELLRNVLGRWSSEHHGSTFGEPTLVVSASSRTL